MRKIAIAFAATSALLLTACEPNAPANPAKTAQAERAAEVANSINFTENSEIDNIRRRLELTSNPGQIGYILLLNEMGKPVMYAGVRGKITSGNKRLTAPQEVRCLEVAGQVGCSQQMVDSPSDEGTYGSSNPYVFFWTTDGQYFQWAGKYLYSDKPFRISDPTIVILSQ